MFLLTKFAIIPIIDSIFKIQNQLIVHIQTTKIKVCSNQQSLLLVTKKLFEVCYMKVDLIFLELEWQKKE